MITSVLRPMVILAVLPSLGGCGATVLSAIGPIADAERTILLDSLAIMLAIVVPTIVAILAFAWWFRQGNSRARYLPAWQYSGQLELLNAADDIAADVVCPKPCEPQDLMRVIRAVLDRGEPR